MRWWNSLNHSLKLFLWWKAASHHSSVQHCTLTWQVYAAHSSLLLFNFFSLQFWLASHTREMPSPLTQSQSKFSSLYVLILRQTPSSPIKLTVHKTLWSPACTSNTCWIMPDFSPINKSQQVPLFCLQSCLAVVSPGRIRESRFTSHTALSECHHLLLGG